jgi:Fe2+ or Zn2+ uptake regulation protein
LGLRLTAARTHILGSLAAATQPATWETLAGQTELRGHCDPATISRALRLLHAAGLLRAISLPRRVRGFLLNAPGSESGLLICRCCGAVVAFPLDDAILRSAANAAGAHAFSWPEHELTCHGLCSRCKEESDHSPPPSKLSAAPARPTGSRHSAP